MPTSNFKVNGTDLDALFEPIGASSKRADVSYTVNGTDISNYYYSVSNGGNAFGTTNLFAGGTDIGTQFAALGSVGADLLLYTWGYGTNGQLGTIGSLEFIPVQIGTDNWTKIGAGIRHTGAIRSDGLLFMFGAGGSGRLGDNSTINRSSPVQIGASSWTLVSLGYDHSAAIRNDGALFTWGAGSSGKLGNDLTINRSSPVQVGSSSWTGIGAGPGYTVGFTNI